jgi:VanZ family protein
MALLFFVSSRTIPGHLDLGWDKLAHAGAYCLLGVLALRACHGGLHWLGARPTLVAVLLAGAYAMVDELHQGRVPGRHASVFDWVADVVGVALAIALVAILVSARGRFRAAGSKGGIEG